MTAFYLPQGSVSLLGGTLILAYLLTLSFYRLYISPLAKFPGPKLAALTLWYEFYYDVVKRGQYLFKIKEMHEQYGPIRPGPYELHVNDPEFIPILYTGGTKPRDKYAWAQRIFGGSEAAIATVSHEGHRMRRGAMNRHFSKESIRRLEPILQENLVRVLDRLQEYKGSGRELNLILPFSAFTSDIIMEYSFGTSNHYLEAPNFNEKFFEMMTSVHGMAAPAKQFGFIMPMMDALPDSVTEKLDEGMSLFVKFRQEMRAHIRAIKEKRKSEKRFSGRAHTTIFDSILDSDLSDREKTVERLWQEAQIFCVAGTETTAWALGVITFYLLTSPNVMRKLREELETAIPDLSAPVESKQLEQLPYLTAVIQEGLRLGYGVSTRLSRVSPDEAMKLNDGATVWEIPPGTPVGMSCGLIHVNPQIFPDPLEFRPQRWLDDPQLTRYLLSFSKGSRQCLGINMAYAELYLCVAGLFRRYGGPGNPGPSGEFELFETTKEDVELQYDLFVPFAKKDSKGIRILIK